MKTYWMREILDACGGAYHGDAALLDTPASSIVIDSRKAAFGSVYVPIVGERLDGHDFIDGARANGASLVLTARPLETEPYILVSDTLRALQAVASRYRDKFTFPVVGLTGSVGKTSTKEMIAAALAPRFRVLKTHGNENNETGVPLTLFRFEDSFEAAVVEMGTNHFGEIGRIAAMAKPDICVFTNIGVAHIENFGSREGILQGKIEMLAHRRPGGQVIVNGDDDMLARIPDALRFGLGAICDVRAVDVLDRGLDGMAFTVTIGGQAVRVHVPSPGVHSVYNALAAISTGLALDMELEELSAGIAAYVPLPGRMNIHVTSRFTLIDDTYNANTTSVVAAIDVLAKIGARRVCVLGDMLELGEQSRDQHGVVGLYAATHGVDLLLCVGPESEATYEAARGIAPHRAAYFATQEELLSALPGLLRDGDAILVKASRGMHLERTFEFLKGL